MWLNKGTTADIVKAHKALSGEGYSIHAFPVNEKDPLGKAKAAVLKAVKASEK